GRAAAGLAAPSRRSALGRRRGSSTLGRGEAVGERPARDVTGFRRWARRSAEPRSPGGGQARPRGFAIQRARIGSPEYDDFPWLARALAWMVSESQMRTARSPELEASRVPSGPQATAWT